MSCYAKFLVLFCGYVSVERRARLIYLFAWNAHSVPVAAHSGAATPFDDHRSELRLFGNNISVRLLPQHEWY